jgi:ABC-2 type transport system ATP-binding protein
VITIENLTKRYGNFTAVSSLSLTVKPGEIYGFLGPNGAGKTTTIKVLAGLLRATEGKIAVCGFDVEGQADEAKRRLGYISDTPEPYERLTGREFLQTVAALFGLKGEERNRRVAEGLALLELDKWGDELVESYSHGMKQKLMISSALIHNPQVVVADEPLVGLDPRSAKKLKEIFRKLAGEGKAIFLSTHILEIAERICDRVGIIMGGKLVAEGTVDELRGKLTAPDHNLEEIFLAVTGAGDETVSAL